jgi:quercetin dioxygenase-like cupin family protein
VTERTIRDPWHKQSVTFVTTARSSGGEVLAAEVRLAPGGIVPRHLHLRQDERVEVAEGTLAVRVGHRDTIVNPGESIDVPRRTLHVIRNEGPAEARFLLQVRPARRMEAAMRALFFVFRGLARLLRRGS